MFKPNQPIQVIVMRMIVKNRVRVAKIIAMIVSILVFIIWIESIWGFCKVVLSDTYHNSLSTQ